MEKGRFNHHSCGSECPECQIFKDFLADSGLIFPLDRIIFYGPRLLRRVFEEYLPKLLSSDYREAKKWMPVDSDQAV